MKIGVVCEGGTDFFAIENYVGEELKKIGIDAKFVLLQPAADESSGGGWGNVLLWLLNNPPTSRNNFFGRGLFSHSQEKKNIDAILMHLDTDVLSDVGFQNYVKKKGCLIAGVSTIEDKSIEVSKILRVFSDVNNVQSNLKNKYICAPIAESSESWCISAEGGYQGDSEKLSGQALIDAFGKALARVSGHAVKDTYANINKNKPSRENFCNKTRSSSENVMACSLFAEVLLGLINAKLFSDVY